MLLMVEIKEIMTIWKLKNCETKAKRQAVSSVSQTKPFMNLPAGLIHHLYC